MSGNITYHDFQSENELPEMTLLLEKDLSEPYSVFTYRYFLHQWPQFSILARDEQDTLIGVVIGKLDFHGIGSSRKRGYIAMLAVEKEHRKQGIGSELVVKVIQKMKEEGAHEVRSPTFNGTLSHSIGHANAVQVVLETELSNKKALQFYERLGFIRDKRLTSYYLNGMDAFRLKLILKRFPGSEDDGLEETDGIL